MRQPVRARAFLAVFTAAFVLGGWAQAQETTGAGTITEVYLPGGLDAARAALGDPGPADRGHFLLETIRRSYQTPMPASGLRRDGVLRPLLDHFDRAAKGPPGANAAPDTLPLPLTPALWATVIPGEPGAAGLVADILRSPGASLLYCALLGLDEPTRAWIAGQPALLAEVAGRLAAPFLLAAPGLRIDAGVLRLPGGDLAAPGWQALAGKPPTDPVGFIRALLTQNEGRVAYFVGAAAHLTPAQIRYVLGLDVPDPAVRVTTTRRMLAVFEHVSAGWNIAERPFWRPVFDPIMLAADLSADAEGRPRMPGSAAFWTAVFADADPDRLRAAADTTAALTRPDPVEFVWICEQIFSGGQTTQRGPYQQVLFASRNVRSVTTDDLRDSLAGIRAIGRYPALIGALERARVTDIRTYANVARRAARLAAIDNGGRAVRAIAQFQGAVTFVTRAASRGSLGDNPVSQLLTSLAALESDDRGDYNGQIVKWLAATVRAAAAGESHPGTRAAGDEAGALDEQALLLLAGRTPGPPGIVEWEGTRYRLDLAGAEMARLRRALGDDRRLFLSAADALAAGADLLERTPLTGDQVTRQAELVARAAAGAGCDGSFIGDTRQLAGQCREIAAALTRAARGGDARGAARLVPKIRLLADDLLARGLMELAYAAALGEPDGASITAGDAASRHDFGLDLPGFGPSGAWRRPVASVDRKSDWHVTGSLLGLDLTLAQYALVRLSTRPPSARPSLNDEDRRVFVEALPLIEPAMLTDADREAIVSAIARGRARFATVRSPRDAEAVAGDVRLGPIRRTLLSWAVLHDPARAAASLSPGELYLLGLGNGPRPSRPQAWGVPGEARTGCPCLGLAEHRPVELFSGRWYTGVMATGFADLNLRLAELLTELRMPAALLGAVLASATWDFTINATSRDFDDRRGLVDFLAAMGADRMEQYLALLTTDGPLVPVSAGSGSEPPTGGMR